MFSERTLSAAGDGRPLGQMTSPLVPDNVGPEMLPPLDLSLLDEVDGGLAYLSVHPPSPKSKKFRDYKILISAKKNLSITE